MKRILSFLLVIIFVFSLSACNNVEKENSSDTESSSLSLPLPDSVSPEDAITARVLAEHPDAEITKITEKEDGSVSATYRVGDRIEIMTIFADGGVGISGPDLSDGYFPSYDEVQAQYPDKTVLIWAISGFGNRHIHTREVNEYLDEQGCEVAVCFTPVECDTDELYPRPMIPQIKKLLDNGERIDIISPISCDEFVFDDLYEPLEEYLETEIGRELYSAFPENLWESLRINGGIYWLCGDMRDILSHDRGYYVNAELAEKYGFDVDKPVLEQLDILKAVKENEKDTDVFSTYMRYDTIAANVNVKMISSAVYWNDDTHSAGLSADNAEYIEALRLYDTLQKENLLNNMGAKHSSGFFIMADNVYGGGIAYADMKPVEVDYFGNSVTAIPVFTPKTVVRNSGTGTGICSKSEHKESAFELLAKVFTDPVLNNLLVYGVEGENYTLENGVAIEIIDYWILQNIDTFDTMQFANQMICYRSAYNLFTPEQYAEIFEKAEVFADSDFTLDPTNIISELNAENVAADNISLPDKDHTLDDVLAEYRNGLYAAGVQKIIDECNRQYEVYRSEKNEKD